MIPGTGEGEAQRTGHLDVGAVLTVTHSRPSGYLNITGARSEEPGSVGHLVNGEKFRVELRTGAILHRSLPSASWI